MLQARSVTIVRGARKILDDVSVCLRPGRLTALIGPNGAGKSTLLRVMSGELRPTSGQMMLDGNDVSEMSASNLANRRAVVPQVAQTAFPFTVLEIVLLGTSVPGFNLIESDGVQFAYAALEEIGLKGFETRRYDQLSGGEKQSVHIARALCQLSVAARSTEASYALLLDEPTASLDFAHQRAVMRCLRRQADLGRAILLVAHDLNLAAAIADEIILLQNGKIVAEGSAQHVLRADVLSRVYACDLSVMQSNPSSPPWVLPMSLDRSVSGAAAE
ncbi:MAG: heme ABC transporter ATP-binding protein [Hyphomicrobium sp.]|nr:MAG: heme ABC transporter ATP-binding protein [Hyphomicrobium sp.]PPD00358.1 MAG: heme ABC transporter ATP-binding protein [Hyphomicrobium sp.]